MGSPQKMVHVAGLILTLLAGSTRALADSYVVEHVLSTQEDNFAPGGGDDFGNYTMNITNSIDDEAHPSCGGVPDPSFCFETHYANGTTVYTTTPPPLLVDPNPRPGDVTSCAIPAAFEVIREFCSDGHLFFSALYDAPPGGRDKLGLFDGIDPTLDYLGYGSIDGGFMTANGNVYFIDGSNNTLDVAIDIDTIPVPEPGAFLMMGTGVLGMAGALRRRFREKPFQV